jgi:hypothetical protein
MRRLLFVDDALGRLRDVEEFLVANGDGEWETTFVDTGEEAQIGSSSCVFLGSDK